MNTTTKKAASPFSKLNKDHTPIYGEISENGLIWRKLKDGTGTWRYDIRINNTRSKGILGKERDGMTLSQARKELINIKATLQNAALESHLNPHSLDKQTFEEAAQAFLAWSKTHHSDFRHNNSRMNQYLLPKFSKLKLGEIRTIDVEELKTEMINNKLSSCTSKKVISLLSSVFNYAKKQDPNLSNPTRGVTPFRHIPLEIQIFSSHEVKNLLEMGAKDSKDKVIIALGRYAGLRASEVLGLDWKHVDLESKKLFICQSVLEGKLRQTTKSGKARWVHFGPTLHQILLQHKATTSGQGLIISPDDTRPYHHIQHIFDRIKKRAMLDNNRGFHALRHTYATTTIEKGIPLPMIQSWMGHSDIKTTMKYVHLSNSFGEEMAKLLD